MEAHANRAPASGTIAGDVTAAEGRLPLVLTVGFTGHRVIEQPAQAERLVGEALATVAEVFTAITRMQAAAFDGAARLRLLIGAAPGTDRIVAATWRALELGQAHLIYPFREPGGLAAYTDDPRKADLETRVETPPDGEPWTGLDATSLGLEHDQAHAEVSRWISRHADLLVAWWDGQSIHGAGGTGDTVRRALEAGVPVIWIAPDEAHPRLVDPGRLHHHAEAAEAMAYLAAIAEPLVAPRLAALLASALAPPGPGADDPEVKARRDYAAVDPLRRLPAPIGQVQALLDHTLWRAFAAFETIAGGAQAPAQRSGATPSALARQPGFQRLRAAANEAASRANHLSSVHRSEQLLLIVIAIAAVFTGALPALTASAEPLARTHFLAAAAEFVLGVTAFFIAAAARRRHRHRRWSDARRLAERLRAACATWPLGFDIAAAPLPPPATWTEWRARAVIRAAGPPCGWIDRPRFDAEATWIADQLIGGQADYHARQRQIAEHIEGFTRRMEGAAFAVLMLTLFGYLVVGWSAPFTGWTPPHWIGGLVTLVSAVAPAIGAGCLALEATNGFGELAQHSEHLSAEFARLQTQLGEVETEPYHHVQAVIRRAAQLVVEDADAWRDRVLRRRIVRGG
jgi:hypothetical protein